MTYIVPLIGYRTPPLSDNDRMHWSKKNRIRQQIHADVIQAANVVKLPKGLLQVKITLHYAPAVERRRDTDNLGATRKPCIDALVRYGLVRDDNSTIVDPQARIHPVAVMPPLHFFGRGLRQPARLWLEVENLASPFSAGSLLGNQPEPPSAA